MIVAYDKNRGIGLANDLPWHISEDLQYFKFMTIGKVVIMGRNTFESLKRKPLPGRINIIVSTSEEYEAEVASEDVFVFRTMPDAIAFASQFDKEIMIIGGSATYQSGLQYASRIYATELQEEFACDTYFPDTSGFEEIYRSKERESETGDGIVKFAYVIFQK